MAGINPYDQATESTFINTYVPIPFQEIAGGLQNRQRSHEQGSARTDAFFTSMKDVQLAAPDEPEYQSRMSELDSQLAGILEKNPDMGSLEFRTALNKVTRETGRDEWWRRARQNKPVYDQLLKDYNEAVADNKPWNYRPLQAELENFQKYGTAGIGALQPQTASAPGDLGQEADALGKGFRSQGSTFGQDSETGEWYVKQGQTGVAMSEVGLLYGYDIDKDGNPVLVQPNTTLLSGEGGRDMQRQAQMIADSTGGDFQEVFMDLYEAATLPFVYKYAGMTETSEQRRTSFGTSQLERQAFSVDAMITNAERMHGDSKWELSKKGRVVDAIKNLNDSFLLLGPMGITQYGIGEAILAAANNGYQDFRDAGLNSDQSLAKIDDDVQMTVDFIDRKITSNNPLSSLISSQAKKGVTRIASFKKAVIEHSFYQVAPDNPGEDYLKVAERTIQSKPESYSSNKWADLSTNERNKLHKQMNNEFETWANDGIHIPVKAVDSKTKSEMSTILLGRDASSGSIKGEDAKVSGLASSLLVIDPHDTKTQTTFNEFVKDKDKIDYIGPVDVTYGNGFHLVNVNGKELLVQVPGINAPEGNPLYKKDAMWQLIPSQIHDYNKHISGIGNWFGVGDNNFRTVTDEWKTVEGKTIPSKVHLEYYPGEQIGVRDAVPNARSSKSVDWRDIEKVYDDLYTYDEATKSWVIK